MQIAIASPIFQARRPVRPAARLGVTVASLALLVVAAGTALAVAGAPPSAGFDRATPALDRIVTSGPLAMTGGAPGDAVVSTTTIALRGSEPAGVRLFAEVTGDLSPFLRLTILRGTGEGAGWVADAGAPVFAGTLASFPTDWASGVQDGTWQAGELHTYRIAVTLTNDARAQGRAAQATFSWESRPV
jgi:hypothetical protein